MSYKGVLQRWVIEVCNKGVFRGGLQRVLQRWVMEVCNKGAYRGGLQRGFTEMGY